MQEQQKLCKQTIQLTAKEICNLISFIEGFQWDNLPVSAYINESLKQCAGILYQKFASDRVHFKTVDKARVYSVFFSDLELKTLSQLLEYSNPNELLVISIRNLKRRIQAEHLLTLKPYSYVSSIN